MMEPWANENQTTGRRRLPLIMGILNVTPDSFSDGGQHHTVDAAVAHAHELIEAGADIIDVGGESTRPGAVPVDLQTELSRTIPVIRRLASETNVRLSIDTMKAEVARQAVDAGAAIVNDVTALQGDPQMLAVCAGGNAGVCLMHMRGTPQTMQQSPQYQDVLGEVIEFLRQRVQACLDAGISSTRLCVDPGIGFGKTAAHNLTLLSAVQRMRESLQLPVLIGHSRKRFLSHLLGRDVDERTAGTIGVAVALAEQGTDVLRVHDVRSVRDALIAWNAVRGQ
jgi:dihydropteroate synthase